MALRHTARLKHLTLVRVRYSRYAIGVRDDQRWTSIRFHAAGVGPKRVNSVLTVHSSERFRYVVANHRHTSHGHE